MQDDVGMLLAAIREMAEAEEAGVSAHAEQEIAGINECAEAQIKRLRSDALSQLEDELRTESERILSAAKLGIRDRLVREKNEALDKVFNLSRKEIAALGNSNDSKETFRRLIQEAISRMNSDDVRLRISIADLSLWESLKGDFPTSISVESCEGSKGTIIVESSDSSQCIDNSLKTRLAMAQEVMRQELGGLLFTDQATGANA